MEAGEKLSLEQIRAVMAGTEGIRFEGKDREEVYDFIGRTLREQGYDRQGREAKGLLRAYLGRMTGLSRAQVTRLISSFVRQRELKQKPYRRNRFASRYTRGDIELLAEADEAHETLSGPATQKILHREFHEFGNKGYERLASISTAHIYNLRKSRTYRERRVRYERTRAVQTAIGERRPPKPDGRPGYLRVDTVHQGDLEGSKGVYHINAVDEVTQWQVAGATAHISEAWLLPVLEGMLDQFPFQIRGFHSDNGSEFINHAVSKLLNKLLVEQTKSRPRRSNDNGLAEAKNGAVIRKHMGYGHIASAHAEAINTFYREEFNPYLNFHRPCGHAEIVTDAKGKARRVYSWYATPWEALRRLPCLAACLRPDLTLDQLEATARNCSDVEAARGMQESKRRLFAVVVQKRTA
jgi:transposase InsO family protein